MKKRPVKERILDAALRLFNEKGFHGVTVEQIVEEAETSKGGFYHNFKSKDELLYQIHEVFITHAIEETKEAYNHYKTPITRLCAILDSFTKIFDLYQSHITVFYQESMYLPESFQKAIHSKRDEYRYLLEQVIREGQETGDFRKEIPANIVTLAIIGMINWTYKWFDQKGPLSMEAIADIFKDFVLHALITETGKQEARKVAKSFSW